MMIKSGERLIRVSFLSTYRFLSSVRNDSVCWGFKGEKKWQSHFFSPPSLRTYIVVIQRETRNLI
jgi:hypothetical protein